MGRKRKPRVERGRGLGAERVGFCGRGLIKRVVRAVPGLGRVGEGEGETVGDESLDVGTTDVLGFLNLNNTEDLYSVQLRQCLAKKWKKTTYLNRPGTGTVTSSHVLVHAFHGISTAELTVLLVHVVGTRARVVAEPDAKVLDLQGLLLVDLEDVR